MNSNSLIIITGLSGAGKSCLLHALEDEGYETIDNLPVHLLAATLGSVLSPQERPLAITIDIRTRHFSQAVETLKNLKEVQKLPLQAIFLGCNDQALHLRYRETRRHHPLQEHFPLLKEAISHERELLKPLEEFCDMYLDTSSLTPPELRAWVRRRLTVDNQRPLSVHVISFAFRRGIPYDADFLFDVRAFNNPFYNQKLRPHTGQDTTVQDFILSQPLYRPFMEGLTTLMTPILASFQQEGRGSVIIAFGCTGGKHRSVCMAEQIGRWAQECGYDTHIMHRDCER